MPTRSKKKLKTRPASLSTGLYVNPSGAILALDDDAVDVGVLFQKKKMNY